jgi:hypothetical protein
MKKAKLFIVLIIACGAFFFASISMAACPITSSTIFAVYNGSGVATDCELWTQAFFDWWKTAAPTISYVKLTATNVKSDCILTNYPNLKLYVQPGGNAFFQQKFLAQAGKDNIVNFINSAGGRYMGTCAGFYYAATTYYWEGKFYDHPYLLGVCPTNEGSIHEIAEYPDWAITRVSSGNDMIYFGGPTYGYQYTSAATAPGTTILTFTTPSSVNGLLAGAKTSDLLLLTVHPEAYNYVVEGLTDAQILANYRWLAGQINTFLGTSFAIP